MDITPEKMAAAINQLPEDEQARYIKQLYDLLGNPEPSSPRIKALLKLADALDRANEDQA